MQCRTASTRTGRVAAVDAGCGGTVLNTTQALTPKADYLPQLRRGATIDAKTDTPGGTAMATRWQLTVVALCTLLAAPSAHGDIYNWMTGEVIPGTEGIEPGPGVQLHHMDLEYAYLDGTDLTGELRGRITPGPRSTPRH